MIPDSVYNEAIEVARRRLTIPEKIKIGEAVRSTGELGKIGVTVEVFREWDDKTRTTEVFPLLKDELFLAQKDDESRQAYVQEQLQQAVFSVHNEWIAKGRK